MRMIVLMPVIVVMTMAMRMTMSMTGAVGMAFMADMAEAVGAVFRGERRFFCDRTEAVTLGQFLQHVIRLES